MKETKKEENIIYSIDEFRRIYLPEQKKVKTIVTPEEAHDFGISLADESLKKIKIKSIN